MDKFLRLLKQFYLNNAKKLYTSLIDYVLQHAIATPAEVKIKKEVFKFINEQSDQNVYTCLTLQATVMCQVMTSLSEIEEVVREAVSEV